MCTSCAIPGHEGTCTDLPRGVDDRVNHCEINAVCDTSHACVGANGKGHFGDPCSTAADCFDGVCRAGVCKLAPGAACTVDVACGSHLCRDNLCVTCGPDTDCPSNQCNGGVCALLGGAYCAAGTDCRSVGCTTSGYCIQSGSEVCTRASCLTHYCTTGTSYCATCSAASDCSLGTACTGGSCLSPAGAYCRTSPECASGTCGPAALLDFKKCR
jgi:hypothetical protein